MEARVVRLTPREAYEKVSAALTAHSLSASEVASHTVRLPGGGESIVGVFERYSWRNSNRMSMTVLCSPQGKDLCEVFFVASGAGSGFLGLFDWGAEGDLEASLNAALAEYAASDEK